MKAKLKDTTLKGCHPFFINEFKKKNFIKISNDNFFYFFLVLAFLLKNIKMSIYVYGVPVSDERNELVEGLCVFPVFLNTSTR